MREIRFISGDSQSLILETPDGEKYRLGVDRSVLDAVKREPTNASQANLTPREIQDAIRSGASVDQLAAQSGDQVEYVLKFALPVIEELNHMLATALSVRVEIEPDRFNERRFREFGDLMDERLRNGGAVEVAWSAHRVSPFIWAIRCDYKTAAGEGSALWHFDPRALTMAPEGESATSLSNASTFGDAPIPKLVALATREVETEPEPEQEPETAPTQLLDVFASRREAANQDSEPIAELEVIELEEFVEEPPHDEPEAVPTADTTRKGRAPMPSWDEIIFGTKAQEDE